MAEDNSNLLSQNYTEVSLPEDDWQREAGIPTLKLKENFPIQDDTADVIKRAYFEKFPEDAFGIDGEFTKKLKGIESVGTQKTSE